MKNPEKVFSRATGNAENYRIPSLVATADDTLIAVADERFFTGADNPNRIDKVVRTSTDGGETWSEQVTAVKMTGRDKRHSSAAIDPATLYDPATDTVFMLYSMTPAGIGILNCKKGTGYADGGIVVKKGAKSYIWKNGELYSGSEPVGIKVDKDGNFEGGNVIDRPRQDLVGTRGAEPLRQGRSLALHRLRSRKRDMPEKRKIRGTSGVPDILRTRQTADEADCGGHLFRRRRQHMESGRHSPDKRQIPRQEKPAYLPDAHIYDRIAGGRTGQRRPAAVHPQPSPRPPHHDLGRNPCSTTICPSAYARSPL